MNNQVDNESLDRNMSIDDNFHLRRLKLKEAIPQTAQDLIYKLILEELYPVYFNPLYHIAPVNKELPSVNLIFAMCKCDDVCSFIDYFFRIILMVNINKALWPATTDLAKAYREFLIDRDYNILLTNMINALCVQYTDDGQIRNTKKYKSIRAMLTTISEG